MKIIGSYYKLDPATWTGGAAVASPSEVRSPGLHVGAIIREIENATIKPGERKATHELSKAEHARMGVYVEMGFIWEMMVEHFFRQRMLSRRLAEAGVVSQQEVDLDGIFLTPDGWCSADDTIEEYKATWRSARRGQPPEALFDAENFWSWGVQNRCYCKAWGTNKGRFFVFFVNGDYRDSGPMVWQYDVTWTPLELTETWDMILRHRKGR
jgi:hypothetical protein